MQIIQANLEHLNEAAKLFDAYRIFYRKESDLEGAKNFLKQRLENKESIIFLAFNEQQKAVGFTQLYPMFTSVQMKRWWHLNDLYVDANERGKGISKLLIARSKELAKATNAAAISLETEKTNTIGNQLYPATGFNIDETNHYIWNNTNTK